MSNSDHLPAAEKSHGKERLTRPRMSAIGTVPTAADRARDHATDGTFTRGNKAATGRNAKRALTAPLRAARRRLQELGEGLPAPVADELLGDAMAVFCSARLELGSSSVFVLAHAVSFATESVLANPLAPGAFTGALTGPSRRLTGGPSTQGDRANGLESR